MPQSRTLSEQEFNGIRDKLLSEAPAGLSEQDFHNWVGPRFEAAVAIAENSPKPVSGSAIGRFVAGAWQNVNPVSLATGLYSAVRHPIDTATSVVRAQVDQGKQALDLAKQGRYIEAAGHAGAAAILLLGPAAANAGEAIASGDVAGGLGQGAGLLAPVLLPRAVAATSRAVGRAAEAAPATAGRVASGLEESAAGRVVKTMRPEVGQNKLRFANKAAADVAPAILKEPGVTQAWTRGGFHANVKAGLEQARVGLDEAADARLAGRAYATKPIINDLLEKRRALTAEPVEGSLPTRISSERPTGLVSESGQPLTRTVLQRKPLGQSVVPGPNAARVAQIDRAIGEIRALGPMARYESLRRIRAAYDQVAKPIYNPAITQDFLKVKGAANGAADVTGTLRQSLAGFDPQTAAANAKFNLYKSADDILSATAEVERARPGVGRKIMSRVVGVLAGEHAGGIKGAIGGYILAPTVDSALSSGVTAQLKIANTMQRLAEAIRAGDAIRTVSVAKQIKNLVKQGLVLTGRTTNPSGLLGQPALGTPGGPGQ